MRRRLLMTKAKRLFFRGLTETSYPKLRSRVLLSKTKNSLRRYT